MISIHLKRRLIIAAAVVAAIATSNFASYWIGRSDATAACDLAIATEERDQAQAEASATSAAASHTNTVEGKLITHDKDIDAAVKAALARKRPQAVTVSAQDCPASGYVIIPGGTPDDDWRGFADDLNGVLFAEDQGGAPAGLYPAGGAADVPSRTAGSE